MDSLVVPGDVGQGSGSDPEEKVVRAQETFEDPEDKASPSDRKRHPKLKSSMTNSTKIRLSTLSENSTSGDFCRVDTDRSNPMSPHRHSSLRAADSTTSLPVPEKAPETRVVQHRGDHVS